MIHSTLRPLRTVMKVWGTTKVSPAPSPLSFELSTANSSENPGIVVSAGCESVRGVFGRRGVDSRCL